MSDPLPPIRPSPRRTFQVQSATPEESKPSSPIREISDPSLLEGKSYEDTPPSRTRSILNLTSSTLFGIYEPGSGTLREDGSSVIGTRNPTPVTRTPTDIDDKKPPVIGAFEQRPKLSERQSSHHPTRVQNQNLFAPIAMRTILLFASGVAYGVIITHLHDDQRIVPTKVEPIDLHTWPYLLYWGMAGIVWGTLLPWVDILWEDLLGAQRRGDGKGEVQADPISVDIEVNEDGRSSQDQGSGLGAEWNPVVRSIGAFIGIAFAIRKLPWQSTLQVSLTLALVNPVLWYLIDRSKPGFVLSTTVGVIGTVVMLGIDPSIVPTPSMTPPRSNTLNVSMDSVTTEGIINNESIGVSTWIASVLFCSCVCFGNIGRKLAVSQPERREKI